MKKTTFIVALIFMLVLTVQAQAAKRNINTMVGLSFSGSTANCDILIIADNSDDEISATTKLWQGKSCIAKWDDSADGVLDTSYDATVSRGKSYTLTVDFTINEKAYPTVTSSGSCP